jgi:acyl-CoA reductase-like NAD-dependent aldehyde dehydrogenase
MTLTPTHPPVTAQQRIGGQWRDGPQQVPVHNPWDGTLVGHAPVSGPDDCEAAIRAAYAARGEMAAMPGHARAAMLRRIADKVTERAEAIGRTMALETGKALRDCVTEAARAADTLRLCAEEAVRIEGQHIPMEASPIGAGKLALVTRFPVGVVAGITPFNAPVNLAAHKLGPALAAGNTLVLKPSPKAPLALFQFIEAVIDAGVPDGAVNLLHGDDIASALIADPRVDFVSFTGSVRVGKIIRAAVGMKGVALELGGVGATIVHSDADLAAAAKACARNGVMLAGQSCVSVQNVLVHHRVEAEFRQMVLDEIATIRFGDPMDPATEVGTLIDEGAARRVEAMIRKAEGDGARVETGGTRQGAMFAATVLSSVNLEMEICRDEIFGPALSIQPYTEVEPIFRKLTDSPLGLQAGIFTASLDLAMRAYRSIRTGGVIVNGTSRWRSDQMPYGGVKDSGIGREGPRFAIRDMTEERLLVLA